MEIEEAKAPILPCSILKFNQKFALDAVCFVFSSRILLSEEELVLRNPIVVSGIHRTRRNAFGLFGLDLDSVLVGPDKLGPSPECFLNSGPLFDPNGDCIALHRPKNNL